uniref:peptidylprolyl isomerase n=1 Tax=Gelidibacter sp. TaxID=2018083 RepID=UPI0040499227
MKITIYILFIFLVFNCQDQPSKQKTETVSKKKDSIQPSNDEEKRKYPLLNDENAMEFFLEFEKENKENKVRITTDFGTIDVLLFEETKFHRANFIFLTKQGYFDGTQFYRIVNNFIIQGGNSDEMVAADKRRKIGKYLLPKDTRHGFKHDKGVLSMPSSEIENPYKMASPYEFFIVQQPGGAKHLDGDYTIFGKVIAGLDVVDTIAAQKTDGSEWPLHNIYIKKVEIID